MPSFMLRYSDKLLLKVCYLTDHIFLIRSSAGSIEDILLPLCWLWLVYLMLLWECNVTDRC